MTSKIDNKDKDKQKIVDDEKVSKAGLPKDWTTSGLQISTDIKFCDMNMEMKEYTLQITEYIYSQMFKGEIVYLKDAAEHIKKAYE